MTIPTTIREELANIRTLMSGVEDSLRTIEAALPPVPPVITLSAPPDDLTEDNPTVEITATLSVPWTTGIQVDVAIRADDPATVDDDLQEIIIPAGQVSGSVNVTVTQFPEFGATPLRKVYVGIWNASDGTFTLEPLSFIVRSVVEPPPPEPLVVTLEVDKNALTLAESDGVVTLTAKISDVLDTDFVVPLEFSGTAVLEEDYTCPDSITIPAGRTEAAALVVAFDDIEVEGDEEITISVVPSDQYVTIDSSSVNLVIVDDDEEPPPPPPPPPPTELTRKYKFLIPDDVLDRIAAAPGLWADVVKSAESDGTADMRVADRLICSALIYQIGDTLRPSKYTVEQHRDRAIAAMLTLCEKPLPTGGAHYDYGYCHPVVLGYDWLRDALTDEQKVIIRGRIVEALDVTLYSPGFNRFWRGYNLDAGCGMVPALAIDGETDIDYVAIYKEAWWAGAPEGKNGVGGLYNREYERDWQEGGGSREGWSYLADQVSIVLARHFWETSTGDRESLNYPWLENLPLLLMHQSYQMPQYSSAGKLTGYRPFCLPWFGYGGEYWIQAGFAYQLAAGTGSRDPQIAALAAWLLTRWAYSRVTTCEEVIFRVLIGDPRVQPKSPEELGLPLDYTTAGTGYHYDRTDWSDDATRVFFGAGETPVRDFPRGNVSIWSKGLPLIASRTAQYSHHYGGTDRQNVIYLIAADGTQIRPTGGSSTPDRRKLGSFKQVGDWFVADMTGFYSPRLISLLRRTWTWDREANVITLLDEIAGADGLKPVAIWNTPLLPVVGENEVTFTNGKATALMTFDRTPAEIVVRGGETDDLFCQLYDGTLDRPEGIANKFRSATREWQIQVGGFYAVYTVPPMDEDGVFRIRTTIKVK